MVLDVMTTGPALDAIVEVVSSITETIIEIVMTSKKFVVDKQSFAELAGYLEQIVPILKKLMTKNLSYSDSLNEVISILHREVKLAKQFMDEYSETNKLYLLVNTRSIAKRLKDITREISRALARIPLISLNISSGIIAEINELCDHMQKAEFKAAVEEEEILEKIESGIQERNVDRSYANNLLHLIAEAVGISTERSVLKKEFEEFKMEMENARLRKDQAEAKQMDQIIALLERADATSSPDEKENKYFTKRNSLGGQPLEPLESFKCPITKEVMVDPVETSSGHTFDRSAIEKWFADGNSLCPVALTPLDTSVLRPNKTLRQSIEEWKERSTILTLALMKEKLLSGKEEQVLKCLEQLHVLCEQRDIHREWVVLENYAPILIKLLGERNRDVRNHALVILCILAKDSDNAKERIVKVDRAIELIVRSLGRRIAERKLAVELLLELSKSNSVRESIGQAQGCMLLLVTMCGSDDSQAARDAMELLENLSFSNDNVIQMAKANYFKPLLQHLSSGPDDVKLIMATTLADMELTDHNKLSLIEDGILGSLLSLISHNDNETKKVAVKTLRNLSSFPRSGLYMIREGAVVPLLDLLCRYSSPAFLSEEVAATITNLALSTTSQNSSETQVSLLESDEDICRLFSLINLRGPALQQNILRVFQAMCRSPSATTLKTKLIQCSALQVLFPLCDLDNHNVRANAVKLLCCLTDDDDEATILEHVNCKSIETFLKIITSSDDDEEIASAMGIISNFPKSPQITEWLMDAGGLRIIFDNVTVIEHNGMLKNLLVENSVGAISHFSDPRNLQVQKKAADMGVIFKLVNLLEIGTSLTKKRAAFSLAQFSASSLALSRPFPRRNSFWCFIPQPDPVCPVHRGICTVQSSFCLVEAGAVGPLTRVLEDSHSEACEAALDALLTLIENERLQSGSKVLDEANTIRPIINLLTAPSPRLQEKVLTSLERIFRQLEFKLKYGTSAHVALVELTQRGNTRTKSLAAQILAHLDVLHEQSSFF